MTNPPPAEYQHCDTLTPLDLRQINVLRIRAAIFGLLPLVLLVIADFVLNDVLNQPLGLGIGLGLFVYAGLTLVFPRRRYRCWGYRQGEHGIRIVSGLLIRKETVVPYNRVQHIDVSRGPIERVNGLATLILHTAGNYNSTVDLPGLALEDANRMRDDIRGDIIHELT